MTQSRTSWALVWIFAIVISATTAYFVVRYCGSPHGEPHASPEGTAYQRVMETHTIRAGYISYPPGTIVDGATHQVRGIFPDLLREIGKDTGLDIQFTEEVGWATLIEGLNTGRYDVIGGVWENPERGKFTVASIPAYYSGIGVWVRSNETRFSPADNWVSLNAPSVKIGAIDGSTPMEIVHSQFQSAQLVTYPNLTTEPQLFLDLVQGRIDVFFAEPSQGLLFLKSNPGAVKNVAGEKPLRVFPDVFLMPRGEFQLKSLIDAALFDLQSSGGVDVLLTKYEPVEGAFYRVATPYSQTPSSH